MVVVCIVATCSAQKPIANSENPDAIPTNAKTRRQPVGLSTDDGLSIIAAALDSSAYARSKRDCSHLVHAIYAHAGFAYPYSRSSDLYLGIANFQRVTDPQPGDLAVWRGHVGIIVNPTQHVFFSALNSGPGIDTYDAPHWKRRGQVRFYRYIKPSPNKIREYHSLPTCFHK